MIFENTWSSIVVFCQALIEDLKLDHPGSNLAFIDWEAHPNIEELPNTDLLGPASLVLNDFGSEGITVTFAIAASTYTQDKALFRHRAFMAKIFEAMRPEKKLLYLDSKSASKKSVYVFTGGTLLAPMTRQSTRPWQYVQAEAHLVPASGS